MIMEHKQWLKLNVFSLLYLSSSVLCCIHTYHDSVCEVMHMIFMKYPHFLLLLIYCLVNYIKYFIFQNAPENMCSLQEKSFTTPKKTSTPVNKKIAEYLKEILVTWNQQFRLYLWKVQKGSLLWIYYTATVINISYSNKSTIG